MSGSVCGRRHGDLPLLNGDIMDVIHPEIAKAKTLPSNYYTDESLYNSLLEKFSTTWNFVGHVAMLEQSTTIPVLIGNNPKKTKIC